MYETDVIEEYAYSNWRISEDLFCRNYVYQNYATDDVISKTDANLTRPEKYYCPSVSSECDRMGKLVFWELDTCGWSGIVCTAEELTACINAVLGSKQIHTKLWRYLSDEPGSQGR